MPRHSRGNARTLPAVERHRQGPVARGARTSAGPQLQSGISPSEIKVWFRFVPREGWLQQDTEGLWATRLGADTARIRNAPFLQNGVAEGDVVQFRTDTDGPHWAIGRVRSAGNRTIGGPHGTGTDAWWSA